VLAEFGLSGDLLVGPLSYRRPPMARSGRLTEFLDARSIFFDESHDVLQLINVTSPIEAQTRLRFCLRRHESGVATSEESPVRCGAPGVCGENRLRVGGQWPHKSSTDLLSAAMLFGAPTEGLRT
jgi:hypothetical protein